MKIALAAVPVKTKNLPFNIEQMKTAMAQCRGEADLILFGESVLQGFDCLCWEYDKDMNMAVSIYDAEINELRIAAKENGLAVSFGYIERCTDRLYSSQILIGSDGLIVHNFHRVSPGWKEPIADERYAEGNHFERFVLNDKRLAIGLCGDLWQEGRPAEMKELNADAVLWPVWCDYNVEAWNSTIKQEYAQQAALCGDHVLLVNPFCVDGFGDCAAGGALHFCRGGIAREMEAGKSGILIVEI